MIENNRVHIPDRLKETLQQDHDISYRMRVMIENKERAEEECAFEIWQSSEQHGLLGPLGLGQEAPQQKIGLS